jgi:hypothetical protein
MNENQIVIGGGMNLRLYYISTHFCRTLKGEHGVFRPKASPPSVSHHQWAAFILVKV